MNVHRNAKLAPAGRALLVEWVVVSRERRAAVAAALGVSARTVGKWVARWQREGPPGLVDRSSRPRRSPRQVAPQLVRRVERLRRRCGTSPAIATALGLPVSTVGRVLRRLGLNRLRVLEPRPVAVRYEKRWPGELVHIDAKRLARFTRVGHRVHGDRKRRGVRRGWEHVHVCIDDATRLAYVEILPAEDGASAAAFVQWVMTDNAFAYTSRAHRAATAALGVRHIRTRPYTPRTNGKAERFIQTCLREWVYARAYRNSAVRASALPGFLRHYNMERPHTALQRRPHTALQRRPPRPCSGGRPRLAYSSSMNNVLSNDS